jgi:hypothetical protein
MNGPKLDLLMSSAAATSLDASVLLGLGLRLRQLLADADHLVAVPVVPTVYPDSRLRFDGPLDAAGANTFAEFSELVNRVPTQPVWSPGLSRHLWDIYGEILDADLAQSSLTTGEQQRYAAASAFLYDATANGGSAASPALQAYRSARDAWLQASIAYRQAQQAASMSSDQAVRDNWTQVDEPRLRQTRDEAMTVWQTAGQKNEVEDALREVSELTSKSPSATWKRHRDTFSPDLPDQFATAPNGTRYAPTFYTPSGALDSPWSRVLLSRDELLALVSQGPNEVTSRLGGGIDDATRSVAFDYYVVSLVRPWLDPFLELAGSRAWRLSENTEAFSDGADPPHGRCTSYVESVVFARNIDAVRREASVGVVSSGDCVLKGTWVLDLDNGVQGSDMFNGDIWWEQLTQTTAQMTPGERARIVNIGPGNYDALGLAQLEPLTYGATPIPGNSEGENQLIDGDVFAVMTSEGNFAKVLVVKYGYNMLIRWTTYKWSTPADQHHATNSNDIYVAGYVCHLLPKCPNPDSSLTW